MHFLETKSHEVEKGLAIALYFMLEALDAFTLKC